MRNYRTAFVAAVLANIALIAILGGLWWRSSRRPKMQAAMAAGANETTQNSPNGLESTQMRSEEHTSELQSRLHLVCRLLLEKNKKFRVGIKSNISTNRNNRISGADRCIHLNAMKKTTITSINRQTIKI